MSAWKKSLNPKSMQDAQKIREEITKNINFIRSNTSLQRILNCAQDQLNKDIMERFDISPKKIKPTPPGLY
jgi:hypothetical protein